MITTEPVRYIRPSVFAGFPEITAAQSTRRGGHSLAAYASQNLGLNTADDPLRVAQNRREFFQALGFTEGQVAVARQVHGTEVRIVEQPGQYAGYDALITREQGVLLTVTTADCLPILLYAPGQQVLSAVHAGWRGTVGGIAGKTLQKMRRHFGVEPADCYAYLGPCIDYCSFEVDADVADYFTLDLKRWEAARGKYLVDLQAANRVQLLAAGLSAKRIGLSPYSTYTDADLFFSYRRDGGTTGRMLTVIGRQE
jgi:YfiH family protein